MGQWRPPLPHCLMQVGLQQDQRVGCHLQEKDPGEGADGLGLEVEHRVLDELLVEVSHAPDGTLHGVGRERANDVERHQQHDQERCRHLEANLA